MSKNRRWTDKLRWVWLVVVLLFVGVLTVAVVDAYAISREEVIAISGLTEPELMNKWGMPELVYPKCTVYRGESTCVTVWVYPAQPAGGVDLFWTVQIKNGRVYAVIGPYSAAYIKGVSK